MVLSGEMMLRHLGWHEAAALVMKGLEAAIGGAAARLPLPPAPALALTRFLQRAQLHTTFIGRHFPV